MVNRRRKLTTREQLQQLLQLAGEEQLQAAVAAMTASRDLEVVQSAINILREAERPDLRDALLQKYQWCQEQPNRRDGGGFIRASIIRAMIPVSAPDDSRLFQQAILTYEMDGPTEVCGDLRAAGLIALNEIDPELAESYSARFLLDPQFTFSGEPVTTAIKVLVSHQNLAPIFAVVSWNMGRNDVIAEGLRSLTDLQDDLVPLLVDRYIENEDEQIILGLFELLLGHRTRDAWASTIEKWFRTTTVMDLYGIVAIQVVASRSETLINMLRNIRTQEADLLRQELLDQALALV